MPCTPCLNTSSAILNASIIDVFLSIICNNLSFGITTNVSTFPFRLSIPRSACASLFFPSNVNGFVTTPMVSIPISFAHAATVGAAPVPVPPPIPAVTNTMSAPRNASAISDLLSSADCAPTLGSAPAPSPLVIFSPICILVFAFEICSACLSVFTAMNSTPFIPASIILLTALFPPPPTPITFIIALPSFTLLKSSSLYSNIIFPPPINYKRILSFFQKPFSKYFLLLMCLLNLKLILQMVLMQYI